MTKLKAQTHKTNILCDLIFIVLYYILLFRLFVKTKSLNTPTIYLALTPKNKIKTENVFQIEKGSGKRSCCPLPYSHP